MKQENENSGNKIEINESNVNESQIQDFDTKLKKIDEKYKYFDNTKDNYDKLFIHEYIENIHLIENNQEIIDEKLNYLKLNQELYNSKKIESNPKYKFKKYIKNLLIEELCNDEGDKSDNNQFFFKIESSAFDYGNNNKNKFYKDDGLTNIL